MIEPQCCWLRRAPSDFLQEIETERRDNRYVAMVLFYHEKATSKVSPKSILNYRTLSVLLNQSQVGIRQHLSDKATLWFHEKIKRQQKQKHQSNVQGFLLFPASSGSCVPWASRCCDKGVAVSWVRVPPGWTGFVSHLLENSVCVHITMVFQSRESILSKKHPRSPLNRLVWSPERRSALIPILHLQKCNGFLQKTWLKLAMFH